jgi:hypothetical protein
METRLGFAAPQASPPGVKSWILVSTFATLAGWSLSAFGQLNRVGYLVLGGAVLVLLGCVRHFVRPPRNRPGIGLAPLWRPLRRRFGRPLPFGFALLSGLVLLGGLLYPPTNHTALTYRIPRVLHWLAEGRWHWIHTISYRMNDRACGIEWLSAPILLFTRSDRLLFALNFIPFLLLPGLCFSLFSRLGVGPRVAWSWMWLLPSGYTFLLQAGSAGNDAFPTVYALAALDFACRAWSSRRASDLAFSVLAAALLTGAKASNLPLLLPWFVLAVPLAPLVRHRPLPGVGVAVLALAVSFLPTAALNQYHCGDWSGLKLERAGMDLKNPWVGLWGNGLLFLLDNLAPPVFPAAGWWNEHALSLLPGPMVSALVANFENGFHLLKELPTEDWAGLGFGLSVLIAASAVAGPPWGLRARRPGTAAAKAALADNPLPSAVGWLVMGAAWVALLAYCVKSGMTNGARLITPYYPLLLPALLIGTRQSELVRRRWWRRMAWGVVGLAIVTLVLTPGRPLWPACTVLARARTFWPGQRWISRANGVYEVYAHRSDPLAAVRALLPPQVTRVGFLADGDDLDISLWRPFFSRRVIHVLLADTPAWIRGRQVDYVVVGEAYLASQHTTLAAWQSQVGAHCVGQVTVTLKVAEGPQPWYLMRMPDFN